MRPVIDKRALIINQLICLLPDEVATCRGEEALLRSSLAEAEEEKRRLEERFGEAARMLEGRLDLLTVSRQCTGSDVTC